MTPPQGSPQLTAENSAPPAAESAASTNHPSSQSLVGTPTPPASAVPTEASTAAQSTVPSTAPSTVSPVAPVYAVPPDQSSFPSASPGVATIPFIPPTSHPSVHPAPPPSGYAWSPFPPSFSQHPYGYTYVTIPQAYPGAPPYAVVPLPVSQGHPTHGTPAMAPIMAPPPSQAASENGSVGSCGVEGCTGNCCGCCSSEPATSGQGLNAVASTLAQLKSGQPTPSYPATPSATTHLNTQQAAHGQQGQVQHAHEQSQQRTQPPRFYYYHPNQAHKFPLSEEVTNKKNQRPHYCTMTDAWGQICPRAFTRPYDLLRHQETVHGSHEKKYCCDLCGYASRKFSRQDSLARHIRRMHFSTEQMLIKTVELVSPLRFQRVTKDKGGVDHRIKVVTRDGEENENENEDSEKDNKNSSCSSTPSLTTTSPVTSSKRLHDELHEAKEHDETEVKTETIEEAKEEEANGTEASDGNEKKAENIPAEKVKEGAASRSQREAAANPNEQERQAQMEPSVKRLKTEPLRQAQPV